MVEPIAVRCLVSGQVQGVWYRASTRDKALELGVAGQARNLADGRVEVLACGPPPAVLELVRWLWKGPPLASVTQVVEERLEPPANLSGFRIG